MTLFDSPAFEGHEGVHSVFDEKSGLKTIIAVHSTARGPAAGGCRMWPYASAETALEDAMRLSRAMSYKNAMADLELGGGKAVIIGDARTQKTPALFEAFTTADLAADPEVESRPDAFYDEIVEINLDTLEPHVVGPHSPDLGRPISRLAPRRASTAGRPRSPTR